MAQKILKILEYSLNFVPNALSFYQIQSTRIYRQQRYLHRNQRSSLNTNPFSPDLAGEVRTKTRQLIMLLSVLRSSPLRTPLIRNSALCRPISTETGSSSVPKTIVIGAAGAVGKVRGPTTLRSSSTREARLTSTTFYPGLPLSQTHAILDFFRRSAFAPPLRQMATG